MSTVLCPHCKAVNRLGTVRCMRCGKPLQAVEVAASRHARDFARREAQGPFFGAFPEALDFSPASLPVLDALITDMWGEAPLALGVADWQPPPTLMPVVIDFGAYLGEVLCRHLPARWEPAPQSPEVVIAARVVDAQGRRINTFAQVAVRFRDGAAANVGMGELYRALTGRTLPRWQMPRRAVAPGEVPAAASAVAPPAVVDAQALLQQAELHRQRGHHGNAIQTLRRLLQAHAPHRQASRWLIDSLFQAGLPAEGFEVLRTAEVRARRCRVAGRACRPDGACRPGSRGGATAGVGACPGAASADATAQVGLSAAQGWTVVAGTAGLGG
jgi:hypothetical protein